MNHLRLLRRLNLVVGLLALTTAPVLANDMPAMPAMGGHHMRLDMAASACAGEDGAGSSMDHGADPTANEHGAALKLVPLCGVTHQAVASGSWTDPATWQNGRIPDPGAKVDVPFGIAVTLRDRLAEDAFDWVRVDGSLSFAPDVDTTLATRTLVVTDTGRLTIGTAADPVRTGVHARLLIAPRTDADRDTDPFDIGGGLVAMGPVEMAGVERTSHLGAAAPLKAGLQKVALDGEERGWQVGDQVIVPGLDLFDVQDEIRTIAAIGADGRSVGLDRPLAFDHLAPAGIAVPIGNMSRNTEVSSADRSSLAARGHVMFMHRQTGVALDGVAFLGLGRTDALRTHTFSALGSDGRALPGSEDNTIGRYAVHFHIRAGARVDVPPHVVRNCVVVDSPKYGIVNHGGNVVVEDNITYRITGSHLVAENGSEIGAFRRNLAIRSSGSGEKAAEARMSSYDFGHGGHGIWSHSGGVEISDNWVSGQASAGIFMMGMPFREDGKEVFFDAANIGGSPYADETGRVQSLNVSFLLARNVVAASDKGLEVWYHKVYAAEKQPRELSVVDGLSVFNVQEQALRLPYSTNIALRDLHLYGTYRAGQAGIDGNALTESIVIDTADIQGFDVGVRLPVRGQNVLRNASLDNRLDIDIPPLGHERRRILIDNVDFRNPAGTDVLLRDSALLYNDLALLFEPDRIDLTDRFGRNRRLYFPFQSPNAVLFPPGEKGPAAAQGLTGAEIEKRFGLAAGGALAPAGATMLPRSNALAAPAPTDVETAAPTVPDAEHAGYDSFSSRWKHFVATLDAKDAEGWRLESGAAKPQLVYASRTPAKFMVRRSLLPLRIHPDDLRYGYRVDGLVVEEVDGHATQQQFDRVFTNLKVDTDGVVRLRFDIASMAGVRSPVELAIQVTPAAMRRGSNVDWYNQREYCGRCGLNTEREDVKRFLSTGIEEPLPDYAKICRSATASRLVLQKPFKKDLGFAYDVTDLAWPTGSASDEQRENTVLCEDDHPAGQPVSDLDDVRRSGAGRHAYWSDQVMFSSSDGTDPNTNGHVYALAR